MATAFLPAVSGHTGKVPTQWGPGVLGLSGHSGPHGDTPLVQGASFCMGLAVSPSSSLPHVWAEGWGVGVVT